MPLIIGQERLIPGFEANLVGLEVGESTEFDITFPDDYPETALAGQAAHFAVELQELREKVLPELDDDFAHARWATSPTSPRSGPTSRRASSATPSTGPATSSPTGSSSTPSPTRRSSCPTS